jgi:hypothetical protein
VVSGVYEENHEHLSIELVHGLRKESDTSQTFVSHVTVLSKLLPLW